MPRGRVESTLRSTSPNSPNLRADPLRLAKLPDSSPLIVQHPPPKSRIPPTPPLTSATTKTGRPSIPPPSIKTRSNLHHPPLSPCPTTPPPSLRARRSQARPSFHVRSAHVSSSPYQTNCPQSRASRKSSPSTATSPCAPTTPPS